MATVVSKTSIKIDELLAELIVNVHVESGYLIITTRGGSVYNAGAIGGDGNAWFSGGGAPSVATGNVGDWYLNSTNGDYYQKDVVSGWTLRGTLRGPQGLKGDVGSIGPAGPQGPEGTVYVDPDPPPAPTVEGHMWYDEDDETLDPFSWNELSDKPLLQYVHDQSTPSATWNIIHNMGYFPSVTVVDSAGSEVMGDVQHMNAYTVVVTFGAAFGGKAYLS